MRARELGLQQELSFWRRFLSSGEYLAHPDWCDVGKERLLFQHEEHLPKIVAARRAAVLDYGSGPVCRLGNTTNAGTPITLFCTDALHREYAKLRLELGLRSRGTFVSLGTLEDQRGLFDLVVCSNALDHTEDPIETLVLLSELARPGGHVLVCGFVNEATHEHGVGLHRFDLSLYAPRTGHGESMKCAGQLVIRDYVTKSRLQVGDLDGRKIIFAEQTERTFKIVWGAKTP